MLPPASSDFFVYEQKKQREKSLCSFCETARRTADCSTCLDLLLDLSCDLSLIGQMTSWVFDLPNTWSCDLSLVWVFDSSNTWLNDWSFNLYALYSALMASISSVV